MYGMCTVWWQSVLVTSRKPFILLHSICSMNYEQATCMYCILMSLWNTFFPNVTNTFGAYVYRSKWLNIWFYWEHALFDKLANLLKVLFIRDISAYLWISYDYKINKYQNHILIKDNFEHNESISTKMKQKSKK